jgi:hypothetical protein
MIASLSFTLSSGSLAADKITQETKGDQSPAQYVAPGGVGTIIYNYTSDISTQFRKCLEIAMDYQTKKLNELNSILAQYFVQQTGASDEDAKKWAQDVIEKAPAFKKEKERQDDLIDQYNKELPKNLLANVYKLFAYIIETIDSRMAALQEIDPKITYEKDPRFILFKDESTSIDLYIIRTAILRNGSRIVIKCVTGSLRQGIPVTCPSFEFTELVEKRAMQTFAVKPATGGLTLTWGDPNKVQLQFKQKKVLGNVMYLSTGAETLTTEFKNQFNANFEEFLKMAYAR